MAITGRAHVRSRVESGNVRVYRDDKMSTNSFLWLPIKATPLNFRKSGSGLQHTAHFTHIYIYARKSYSHTAITNYTPRRHIPRKPVADRLGGCCNQTFFLSPETQAVTYSGLSQVNIWLDGLGKPLEAASCCFLPTDEVAQLTAFVACR